MPDIQITRIVDALGRQPSVANAHVTANNAPFAPSGTGFQASGLPAGPVSLRICVQGYPSITQELDLSATGMLTPRAGHRLHHNLWLTAPGSGPATIDVCVGHLRGAEMFDTYLLEKRFRAIREMQSIGRQCALLLVLGSAHCAVGVRAVRQVPPTIDPSSCQSHSATAAGAVVCPPATHAGAVSTPFIPLGTPAWLAVAVAGRGQRLAIATTRSLEWRVLPGQQLLWERPLAARRALVATDPQGSEVAHVMTEDLVPWDTMTEDRSPGARDIRLRVLRGPSGDIADDFRVARLGQPGPWQDESIPRRLGLWGLVPFGGWLIQTTQGALAVGSSFRPPPRRGQDPPVVTSAERLVPSVSWRPGVPRLRAAQDAPSYWQRAGGSLVHVRPVGVIARFAPAPSSRWPARVTVCPTPPPPDDAELPFAVDEAQDRAALLCVASGTPGTIVLARLSTGEVLSTATLREQLGAWHQVALLDPTHVVLLSDAARCTWSPGAALECEGFAGLWSDIRLSPDGAYAVGIDEQTRRFQVLHVPTGVVACDQARVAIGQPAGAGFLAGGGLWVGDAATRDVVELDAAACRVRARYALPRAAWPLRWLPAAQAFLQADPPQLLAADGRVVRALPWAVATIVSTVEDGSLVALSRPGTDGARIEIRAIVDPSRPLATVGPFRDVAATQLCPRLLVLQRGTPAVRRSEVYEWTSNTVLTTATAGACTRDWLVARDAGALTLRRPGLQYVRRIELSDLERGLYGAVAMLPDERATLIAGGPTGWLYWAF